MCFTFQHILFFLALTGQAALSTSIVHWSLKYLSGFFPFGTILLIQVRFYEISDGFFNKVEFIERAFTGSLLLEPVISVSAELVSEFSFDASR